MTDFNLKMINHAGVDSGRRGDIEKALQAIFDDAFSKVSDSVVVGWGSQADSDSIRVHHVEDVAASVIVKHMPRPPTLRSNIGGHTSQRNGTVGSEFYNRVNMIRNGTATPTVLPAVKMAGLIFHECLHNVDPDMSEEDIGKLGGYGKSPVEAVMTDDLRTHITGKITKKRAQLLVPPKP